MELELTEKQQFLMTCDADIMLYGGARGGGKTFVDSVKVILDIVEWYTEEEVRNRKIDVRGYRCTDDFPNDYDKTYYFKYTMDYLEFRAICVRKTEPALRSNTLEEQNKTYKGFGATWIDSKLKWVFPSGAEVHLHQLGQKKDRDFFQGPNYHYLYVGELTQFDRDEIEEIEACCRSAHPYIRAKKIYDCNPGNRGHVWVKKKYVDICPPIQAKEPVYVKELDMSYYPLNPSESVINEKGEKVQYIPALVFDNPHLMRDKNYVNNLKGKGKLTDMWLFGRWDVFQGQFFTTWDDNLHIKSEMKFFKCTKHSELENKKKNFDWSNWRLFSSNDYGFASTSAWACGFYAVNDDTDDIVKFAEIVESNLTIKQQAQRTKQFLLEHYNLKPDDFELHIGDPNSYWQRRDKAEGDFWTFADVYLDEGIYLTKGYNDREPGAAAMAEALRIREETGTPRLTILDCCQETIDCIPNLPQSPKNPNDVDTTVFDHPYDECRYFIMVLIGKPVSNEKPKKKGWRDRLAETQKTKSMSWKAA